MKFSRAGSARNELAAIKICGALGDAQAEYHSQPRDGATQYAQKFISDEGKQNGLYWQAADGQPKSPLGPLAAFATAEGYAVQQNAHQPFHGYYFRMLTKQGAQAKGGTNDYVVDGKMTAGFAFVAYPAEQCNHGNGNRHERVQSRWELEPSGGISRSSQ